MLSRDKINKYNNKFSIINGSCEFKCDYLGYEMDTSAASKRPLSYLADELEKPSTSHGTLDKSGSGAGNSCLPTRPLTEKEKADEARNKKCIQELLPWILEIENDTHEYLGNLTDPKNNPILDSMNYLIRYVYSVKIQTCGDTT